MPVQYSGIIDEHHAVRQNLGVFDISHMGQFFAEGPQAAAWLNRLLTNNIDRLLIGQCQYTLLLNPAGGVIDDLIVYRIAEHRFLLVVNASKIEEDFAWMLSHLDPSVSFENHSDHFAGFAIQGPQSAALFKAFFPDQYPAPAHNEILSILIDNQPFYIARTGYTGEDGFEVFCPSAVAVKTWNDILEKGLPLAIKPCGLGSRDTLRLEMCYPLNGSDLNHQTSPLEAGLGFFVDLSKTDFIGRSALAEQKSQGIQRRLVPFKMVGPCPPPRSHYPIFIGDQQIAETTSGSLSPTLQTGIGLAYIPTAFAQVHQPIEIEIRGKRFPALLEKKPLHRPALPSA